MSEHFNVPISQQLPPGFPVNTLPVQRALASLSLSHPQKVERAIELFYYSFWVEWNDPTKSETLQAILRTALHSDEGARKVVERAKTEEVKQRLDRNTYNAFENRAFRLPWFTSESRFHVLSGEQGVLLIVYLSELLNARIR